MSNLQRVTDFCEAWRTRDTPTILGYLTEDCFYHNIPIEPVVGIEAIGAFITGFMATLQDVEFVVRHAAEGADGAVLTERVDRLKINGRWVELPVMGAFELRDGKISHWRDYYDQKAFDEALGATAG
jgi:limonene-1,2-epoxide hydrolase